MPEAVEDRVEEQDEWRSFDPSTTYATYNKNLEDWDFYLNSYEASVRDYINKYLIRNTREGTDEYNSRKNLAYRENHSKQIINLFNSYLFKDKPSRIATGKTEKYWTDFSKDVDGNKTSIDLFMRKIDRYSSALGRVYLVMDRKTEKEPTGTHHDNLTSKHYMYMVYPQDVLQVAYNDYGNVKWAVIREIYSNDDNPFSSDDDPMEEKIRYRLWTENNWYLYHEDEKDKDDFGSHNVGYCPVFYIDNSDKADKFDGTSLINEAVYIDKAIFNNLSRLSQIIEDQSFSQLVMPVEGMVVRDEDLKEEAMEMSTKSVLLYSATAGIAPQFISPDASQAKMILETIEKQIHQLYNSLGLQSEVEKLTSESGSAKEYTYSRLNSSLTTKAERLEELEYTIVDALSAWMDTDLEVEIIYPESFDVKTLQQEILYAQELSLLEVSETFQKALHKRIAIKALPKATKELKKKIDKEIDESTPFLVFEEKPYVNPITSGNNSDKNIAEKKKSGSKGGGKLKQEQNKVSNL